MLPKFTLVIIFLVISIVSIFLAIALYSSSQPTSVVTPTPSTPVGFQIGPNFSGDWGSMKLPQAKANHILGKVGFRITNSDVTILNEQNTVDSVSVESSHTFDVQAGNLNYTFNGISDYQWKRINSSEWKEVLTLTLESNDIDFRFSENYERTVKTQGGELHIEDFDKMWQESSIMPNEILLQKHDIIIITPIDQKNNLFTLDREIKLPGVPLLEITQERKEKNLTSTSIEGESTVRIMLDTDITEIQSEYQRTSTQNNDFSFEIVDVNPFWVTNAEYSQYDIVFNGNLQYSLNGIGQTESVYLGQTSAGDDQFKINVSIPLKNQTGSLLELTSTQELTIDGDGNISIQSIGYDGELFEFFVDPLHDALPIPPQPKAIITIVLTISGFLYEFLVAEPEEPQLSYGSSGKDKCLTEDHYRTGILVFVIDEQPIIAKTLDYSPSDLPNIEYGATRYGVGPESMAISFKNFGTDTQSVEITLTAKDAKFNSNTLVFTLSLPGCPP